jgi:FkbM family methyltransferase
MKLDTPMPLMLQAIVALARMPWNFGARRMLRRLFPDDPAARRAWIGMVTRIDGLRMRAGTRGHLEREVLLTGNWEPVVTQVIDRVLAPGDGAFDVGANIGFHSLSMARRVQRDGRVIAIEPNPRVRTDLQRNLSLNAISWVEVLSCAVGDQAGVARLKMPALGHELGGNQGLSSISALDTPSDSIEVNVETIDQLLASRGPVAVKLVKIDTQGYDAKVIRGMRELMATRRPLILFEYEDWAWRSSDETLAGVAAWLEDQEYSLWTLASDRGRIVLHRVERQLPSHADMLAAHRSFDIRELGVTA